MATTQQVQLKRKVEGRAGEVLTSPGIRRSPAAQFGSRRQELLRLRGERQRIDGGEMPQFLVTTSSVRDSDWQVADAPGPAGPAGQDAGPTDARC
jgi:hypothetical protein